MIQIRRQDMNYNDWKWWKEKLHNYKEIDSLSNEEKSRVIFCCLEFIINSLQPEASKREDLLNSDSEEGIQARQEWMKRNLPPVGPLNAMRL